MTRSYQQTADYHRKVEEFVIDNVIHCVSNLVHELTQISYNCLSLDTDTVDELQNAWQITDYETAAYEWLESADIYDICECLYDYFGYHDLPDDWDVECDNFPDDKRDKLIDELREYIDDLQGDEYLDFCEANEIDTTDHYHEVYEHWVVTGVLARELEMKGEKIISLFDFDHIWCRTTTGQSISIDHVITTIYDSIQADING